MRLSFSTIPFTTGYQLQASEINNCQLIVSLIVPGIPATRLDSRSPFNSWNKFRFQLWTCDEYIRKARFPLQKLHHHCVRPPLLLYNKRSMAISQTITTPEGIDITLDLGGVGTRSIAAIVDHLLQLFLIGLVMLLGAFSMYFLVGVEGSSGTSDFLSRTLTYFTSHLVGTMVVVTFLVFWGYFIFFEAFWDGRTPGKRWCHLRVRTETGAAANFPQIMLRNLLRIVDFLPGFYGVGLLTMLFHPQQKRLGDLAAGTVVVKERPLRLTPISEPVSSDIPPSSSPLPFHRLTPSDIELLQRFAERRGELPEDGRIALAHKLASGLATRLATPLPEDPEVFLLHLLDGHRARRPSR